MKRFSSLATVMAPVMAGVIALSAAVPALAQSTPPTPPAVAPAGPGGMPMAHPPVSLRGPGFSLDFGFGRKVSVQCGDQALQACIEAAKPLIEKVEKAPVPERAFMKGARPGKDGKREGRPGKDGKPVPPPAGDKKPE